MKFGDWVKGLLRPFVVGTKWEKCELCEERRKKLNNISIGLSDLVGKIICPCYWKKLWYSLLKKVI